MASYKREFELLRDEVRLLRDENRRLKVDIDHAHNQASPTHMGEPVLREFVEDGDGYFLYGNEAIRFLRKKLESISALAAEGAGEKQ